MNNESQARWYAIKLILKYFSVITVLIVKGYIDLFYLIVVVVAMLVVVIASAVYSDAYYSKLLELNKGRWNAHKD